MFRNKTKHREFKKGVDADEARIKREQSTVQLRKARRDQQLAKRRSRRGTEDEKTIVDVDEQLKRLPQLTAGIMTNNPELQVKCTIDFRKLLSIERNPPIKEVLACPGVVNRLVEFLTYDHNQSLQFEAAWALTNIASGSTADTTVIIKSGAVKLFVRLLSSPNPDVREQAVWALGNIAGDSTHFRDFVLDAGALPPLAMLCVPTAKATLLRNATWTLSNLCRGKPQPEFAKVSPALGVLARLLHSPDDEVLTDACWALSYLSDDTGPHNHKIQAVISSGVARRLVELLMYQNTNVKTPALRTVGNIVTGTDVQTQCIINSAVLPCLLALLSHMRRGIRKEACWTISNITAGTEEQIDQVINAHLVPPLIDILRNDDFDIQKEAAWAISNATSSGSDAHIDYLVQEGVVPPLCELLHCPDPHIVMVALEGIENILRAGKVDGAENKYCDLVEQCRGVDALEMLQSHVNEEIYEKAVKVIQEYFEMENDNAELAPQVTDDNQFAFGMNQTNMPQDGFNF